MVEGEQNEISFFWTISLKVAGTLNQPAAVWSEIRVKAIDKAMLYYQSDRKRKGRTTEMGDILRTRLLYAHKVQYDIIILGHSVDHNHAHSSKTLNILGDREKAATTSS